MSLCSNEHDELPLETCNPLDLNQVHDDEILFRGVPNQPSFIKADGSITSAALKDCHGGVSVDRDGKRPDSDVIDFLQNSAKLR